MTLANFRPDNVGKVFGQDHLIATIQQWIGDHKTVPQSILFQGAYGCGKTTLARMLANSLATTSRDIIEINMANSTGVDSIRDLIESVRYSPFGMAKVFILDELHRLTAAAQSAFLKTLEEPPKATYFFLCTTEPSKLLPTIRSRCTHIEVRLLNKEASMELMLFLSKGRIPQLVMEAIALKAGGHARDIVKLVEISETQQIQTPDQLDQIAGFSQDQILSALRSIKQGRQLSQSEALSIQQSEEAMLGWCVDAVVDESVFAQEPIKKFYFEFLQVRVMRKEYKITSRDQLNHFVSVMNDAKV